MRHHADYFETPVERFSGAVDDGNVEGGAGGRWGVRSGRFEPHRVGEGDLRCVAAVAARDVPGRSGFADVEPGGELGRSGGCIEGAHYNSISDQLDTREAIGPRANCAPLRGTGSVTTESLPRPLISRTSNGALVTKLRPAWIAAATRGISTSPSRCVYIRTLPGTPPPGRSKVASEDALAAM